MAARMPMIAMTVRSSIRVKALRARRVGKAGVCMGPKGINENIQCRGGFETRL